MSWIAHVFIVLNRGTALQYGAQHIDLFQLVARTAVASQLIQKQAPQAEGERSYVIYCYRSSFN